MAIKTLDRLTPDGQVWYDSEMQLTEAFINPGPWTTAHGPAAVRQRTSRTTLSSMELTSLLQTVSAREKRFHHQICQWDTEAGFPENGRPCLPLDQQDVRRSPSGRIESMDGACQEGSKCIERLTQPGYL